MKRSKTVRKDEKSVAKNSLKKGIKYVKVGSKGVKNFASNKWVGVSPEIVKRPNSFRHLGPSGA